MSGIIREENKIDFRAPVPHMPRLLLQKLSVALREGIVIHCKEPQSTYRTHITKYDFHVLRKKTERLRESVAWAMKQDSRSHSLDALMLGGDSGSLDAMILGEADSSLDAAIHDRAWGGDMSGSRRGYGR